MNQKNTGASQSDFPTKLSKPAQRALAGAGYTSLEQLTKVTAAEIAKLHGMGPKGIGQLRLALADKGLAFAESTKASAADDH
jgi:hypothetical protein